MPIKEFMDTVEQSHKGPLDPQKLKVCSLPTYGYMVSLSAYTLDRMRVFVEITTRSP